MNNRICLTPSQALRFAGLPMIVSGDDKLVDAAYQVKASDNSGAYFYVSVGVASRNGGTEEVRICVRKDVGDEC